VKARVLGPDGVYQRAVCPPGQEPTQAQLTFRNLARKSASSRMDKTEKLPVVVAKKPAA
jgi:hypothetical protein